MFDTFLALILNAIVGDDVFKTPVAILHGPVHASTLMLHISPLTVILPD